MVNSAACVIKISIHYQESIQTLCEKNMHLFLAPLFVCIHPKGPGLHVFLHLILLSTGEHSCGYVAARCACMS